MRDRLPRRAECAAAWVAERTEAAMRPSPRPSTDGRPAFQGQGGDAPAPGGRWGGGCRVLRLGARAVRRSRARRLALRSGKGLWRQQEVGVGRDADASPPGECGGSGRAMISRAAAADRVAARAHGATTSAPGKRTGGSRDGARYARRSSALTLTLATPRVSAPCSSLDGQTAGAVQDERDGHGLVDRGQPVQVEPDRSLVKPWTLPTATASASTPVAATNSAACCGSVIAALCATASVETSSSPAVHRVPPPTHTPCVVSAPHRLPGQRDVLGERQMRAVDHHRGVARLDAGGDLVQVPAVVQVHAEAGGGPPRPRPAPAASAPRARRA